jgi:hypothetical protein
MASNGRPQEAALLQGQVWCGDAGVEKRSNFTSIEF